VFFAALFARTYDSAPIQVVITIPPDTEGLVESWSGIYVQDQKIGYSLSRQAPRGDGGRLLQERTQLRLVLLGSPNDITLASDVSLGPSGQVERLFAQVRTGVAGVPVSLRVEGEPKGEGMELRVVQAGAELTTMELPQVPATPSTIYPTVAERNPPIGERLVIPYFSPLSLGRAEAVVTVVGHRVVRPPGEDEVEALVLKVEHSGQVLEAIVAPDGRRIEEREVEGGLGMRLILEDEQTALYAGWPADGDTAVDLIALSSIPIDRKLPGGGRELRRLVVQVDGPEVVDELLTRFHEGRWDSESRQLVVEIPDPGASPSYTLPSQDRAVRAWLRSTALVQSDDAPIRRHAGRVVGDDLDARDAARKLERWVYRNISKVPVAGVPSAREVLGSQRGDCNEHTTLYTALARSIGLPTKMAAGIVYSESIFADGAFYYHAWPEVWLGDGWVPLDPTFGQFPADATHIKLVEGALDRQMEIMGVIGRLRLTVVEVGG
jgi:hypothetical protein